MKKNALARKQVKQLVNSKARFLVEKHFNELDSSMSDADLFAYFSLFTEHTSVADRAVKFTSELLHDFEEDKSDEPIEDSDEEVFYEEDAH